jgi:plastocyanin
MRSVLAVVAVTSCAICAATCGSDSSNPASPSSSPSPSNAVTITINRQAGNLSFSPNPASAGGQLVVFRNADTIIHRVQLNDLSVDTGDLAPGATSRAMQMPMGGTNYHCSLHPDMVGAINASGGAPPPVCEGIYCDTAR